MANDNDAYEAGYASGYDDARRRYECEIEALSREILSLRNCVSNPIRSSSMTDFRAFRERTGLSQTVLGRCLGISLRTYQEIESGSAPVRLCYKLALERFSLALAIDRMDFSLALPAIRDEAFVLARLIGQRP